MPALLLRPLRAVDEMSARAAHAELAPEDFEFLLDWSDEDDWYEYLKRLRRIRRGDDLPDDLVPATFLVAEVGSEIVGRASIRHELNGFLENFAGHIGYGVRPQHRGRGYAAEILRQSLVVARAEGVERVLVTCDDDNIASARVIEQLGGVLEDVRPFEGGVPKRRYWIA